MHVYGRLARAREKGFAASRVERRDGSCQFEFTLVCRVDAWVASLLVAQALTMPGSAGRGVTTVVAAPIQESSVNGALASTSGTRLINMGSGNNNGGCCLRW